MIAVALIGGKSVNGMAIGLAVSYYAILIFGVLGMFGSSFLDLPVGTPKNVYTLPTWITSFITWAALAFVGYAYASATPFLTPGNSVNSLRLAAAILVSQVLLFRLLFDLRQPGRVDRLVQIRRDLVLGNSELSLAARSADVTLSGISGRIAVEEFLLRTISSTEEFLYSSRHARIALQDAVNAVQGAEELIATRTEMDNGALLKHLDAQRKRAKTLSGNALRLGKTAQRKLTTFNKLIEEVKAQAPADLENLGDGPLPLIAERAKAVLDESGSARTEIEAGIAAVEARFIVVQGKLREIGD